MANSSGLKPVAFFDLDGTLRDTAQYYYPRAHQISIYPGVRERLAELRERDFLLAGVTNQGGVSKGVISRKEVEAANLRTQEMLGDARLDLLLYCPHHYPEDGRYCDCKKPAPGLLLDTLTAFPGATLDGSFVVGDNASADGGAAQTLALPFVDAYAFRRQSVDQTLKDVDRSDGKPQQVDPNGVAGALVGMAVGDALGAPVEFWPRERVRSTYGNGVREMMPSHLWAAGEYTDDTQMALLLANSLLENGSFQPSDVARRFRNWATNAKDVGLQIGRVIRMSNYTEHPEDCARRDYTAHPANAAGNGAVMRCAPLALFRCNSMPMMLADTRRSARVTHGDPKAQSSCVLVNAAIAHFLRGGGRDKPWRHGIERLARIECEAWARLGAIDQVPEAEISSGGYTVATVEAAFWCFARTTSFEDAVVLANALGGDADTVAAVTGALAGAYYGYSAIPLRWRQALLGETRIRTTALRLAGLAVDSATAH